MSALDASPFPWQRDLLHRFRQGEVVSSLDIPTGLGKTAVMAVWLVARALGAALPRRLVYVVDRRAVVDQATDVAESLRAWVANERGVADALGLDDRRLPISTLRGQYVDNRQWLEDPSSPAIVSKRLNSTKTLSVVDLANVAETRGGDGGRHGR